MHTYIDHLLRWGVLKIGGRKKRLTTISAITRGCLMGLNRKASKRVMMRTNAICRLSNGNAKCTGLSPCHTPFDVAAMGVIQVAFVVVVAMLSVCSSSSELSSLQEAAVPEADQAFQLQHNRFHDNLMTTSRDSERDAEMIGTNPTLTIRPQTQKNTLTLTSFYCSTRTRSSEIWSGCEEAAAISYCHLETAARERRSSKSSSVGMWN